MCSERLGSLPLWEDARFAELLPLLDDDRWHPPNRAALDRLPEPKGQLGRCPTRPRASVSPAMHGTPTHTTASPPRSSAHSIEAGVRGRRVAAAAASMASHHSPCVPSSSPRLDPSLSPSFCGGGRRGRGGHTRGRAAGMALPAAGWERVWRTPACSHPTHSIACGPPGAFGTGRTAAVVLVPWQQPGPQRRMHIVIRTPYRFPPN